MKAALTLLLLLLLTASPVQADERPPRYDINGFCNLQSPPADGAISDATRSCLLAQGEALSALKRQWPDLPEYMRRDCALRARKDGDGDYLLLKTCVRDQLRLALPGAALPAPPH
jgi:hypothetical protein